METIQAGIHKVINNISQITCDDIINISPNARKHSYSAWFKVFLLLQVTMECSQNGLVTGYHYV